MEAICVPGCVDDLHDVPLARNAGFVSGFSVGSAQSIGGNAGEHNHHRERRRGCRGDYLLACIASRRAPDRHDGGDEFVAVRDSAVGVRRQRLCCNLGCVSDAGRSAGRLGRHSRAFERTGGGRRAQPDAGAGVSIGKFACFAHEYDSVRIAGKGWLFMGHRGVRNRGDRNARNLVVIGQRRAQPKLCTKRGGETRDRIERTGNPRSEKPGAPRVRQNIMLEFRNCAPVAQLDRASGYEPEGREFESPRARHLTR
jgi:hypothetical protein